MKRVCILLGLLIAVTACDEDNDGGTQDGGATTPEPGSPSPSPGEGPGEASPSDEDCPSDQPPEGGSCELSFMVDCTYDDVTCNCFGFADPVWDCGSADEPFGDDDPVDAPDNPAEPTGPASENPLDCPQSEPGEGAECTVSFITDCNYDGSICNCLGGAWSCGGVAEPEPQAEDEPEPQFPNDGEGGGPSEPESVPLVDGGTPADGGAPQSENPESCPEDAPESDVCDIDNIGFGTACRYGYQRCTCGGFPGEGVWACEYEFPPNPESCPDELSADAVCDIETVGFGTECRFGDDLCVCGGFPGAGEWQCMEALSPEPEPVDAGGEPAPQPGVMADAG